MLYKFLLSKKGFTLVELMVVATILGILTAVSIPVFSSIMHKQRLNDCKNQRTVFSATIEQIMSGMMDSGKKQPKIDFSQLQSDHYTQYPGDGVKGNLDDAYVGKNCFILWNEKVDTIKDSAGTTHAINQLPVTFGDVRGKHRSTISNWQEYANDSKSPYSYNDGCAYDAKYAAEHINEKSPKTNPQAVCFLKKTDLAADFLYEYLFLDEKGTLPVCPLVGEYTSKNEPEYFYYIFEDGTVLCSCPDCNTAE